uniref:Raptor N-terminal CASPase-like domain-containing protein n=1 Tax=Percolomonas cosmopolitus TaxID=63605 RepID=A0A7S1KTW0_9EUKA|mmetsp:Transcript_8922/g.32929  ORF Transcript_8922/g.32929 Transcript_8922/m.32929 type:complete len:1177 (+) Transcript_8922:401-3931(+)
MTSFSHPRNPVFQEPRHLEPKLSSSSSHALEEWKLKNRLKTCHVALVACLNIGVDPPDVLKVEPCPKLECWIDPFSMQAAKAKEAIGNALKKQYSRWQPRARYKQCLDPTVDEIKKTLQNLRRSAKKERVLFHYNGHGVPKPTSSFEIWVFNRSFTQYIPLSLYDLMDWIKKPAIYLFDCNHAAILKDALIDSGRAGGDENGIPTDPQSDILNPDTSIPNIVLAACQANEMLPMNPSLPADLFTSCLTTPIKMALQFFLHNNKLLTEVNQELIEDFPGRLQDRRTPLGELNWIFTAVTDTIAWSVLPRHLFHKLFRQDLLVACLFRNFLLADRIMRTFGCTPYSYPQLPETFNHPMWESWDLAVDVCVSQLPKIKDNPDAYEFSDFFSSQLTDFEVWLKYGYNTHQAPKQLPILLQVLLSQAHRLKALDLLAQFLDMGDWAVNMALSVGIFPYVLKLLQSPSLPLKRVLVFIWTRILALDERCLSDLLKEHGHCYFIDIIVDHTVNDSVMCAQACFVLANLLSVYTVDQLTRVQFDGLLKHLQELLVCSLQSEEHAELSQWLCLTIAKLVQGNLAVQTKAFESNLQADVIRFLSHRVPEVRAAAVYCLSYMIDDQNFHDGALQIGTALYRVMMDGCVIVRRELVHALFRLLWIYQDKIPTKYFKKCLDELYVGSKKKGKDARKGTSNDSEEEEIHRLSKVALFSLDICKVLTLLASDPVPKVARMARDALERIRVKIMPSSDYNSPSKSPQRRSFPFMKRTHSEPALNQPSAISENDLLKSSFYEWSKKQFVKPKSARVQHLSRKTRDTQHRLDVLAREAESLRIRRQYTKTFSNKIQEQISCFTTEPDLVGLMKFHPFDKTIVTVDQTDHIHIWDWMQQQHVTSFHASAQLHCQRVTDFCFINERFDPMLLCVTGSNGNSCFYRNYASKTKKRRIVSGLRAVPAITSSKGSYVMTQWQPVSRHMIYAGDFPEVKIWDLNREICDVTIDLTAHLDKKDSNRNEPLGGVSCLCNVSVQENEEHTFACGTGDGSILFWDRRTPESPVIEWENVHDTFVLDVATQQVNRNALISTDESGLIQFFDVRKPDKNAPYFSFQVKNPITAFTVHNIHDLIAVGSNDQFIKIYDTTGKELSTVQYHEGFFVQRIGPVSALAFHPYKLILGNGSTDRILSVYSVQ